MKPKQLQYLLSSLEGFEKPKIALEQYATSAELAVSIVTCIDDLVGLKDAFVADLGCGCGMLSTAVAAYEPSTSVFGVEIDDTAIATCLENWEEAEVSDRCHLVQANVLSLDGLLKPEFDLVVMNPPFGTKNNSGLDMRFVKAGMALLRPGGSLFSLHKTSTRDFVVKTGKSWPSTSAECVAQLRWDLPATYKFHKKKSVDIDVDLIQFKKL